MDLLGVDTATPSGGHTGTGGQCPIGYYCPSGTTLPLACEPGSYRYRSGDILFLSGKVDVVLLIYCEHVTVAHEIELDIAVYTSN